MGNLFSRTSTNTLESRIVNLENLDRNHDKVVTKTEFEQWIKDLNERIKLNQQMHAEVTQQLNLKIHNLEVDKLALQKTNQLLENKIKTLMQVNSATAVSNNNGTLDFAKSKVILETYIEELLQDPEININYFPDGLERQIYRNVFGVLLGALDKVVENTSLNVLGHTIKLEMTAKTRNLERSPEIVSESPIAGNSESPVADNPESPIAGNSESPIADNPESPVAGNPEKPSA